MSSKPDVVAPRAGQKEIVHNFEAARVAAPFFLRCGAMLIDYIVFLIVPVGMMLLGRYLGTDGARLVAGSLNDTGWLIAILIGAANFVLLPLASGRSVGKLVTGLRIIRADGRQANPIAIILRQTLGYLTVVLSLGAGFFLSAFTSSGRTLHDILFGTVVVYAERKFR